MSYSKKPMNRKIGGPREDNPTEEQAKDESIVSLSMTKAVMRMKKPVMKVEIICKEKLEVNQPFF